MNRTPLGQTRTKVCRDHAVIAPDSHVHASLFGWDNTSGVMLISPAMSSVTGSNQAHGPAFAQYLVMMTDRSITRGAASGVQRCVYVLEGTVQVDGNDLRPGAFAYLPADFTYTLSAESSACLLVFEKQYLPIAGVDPPKSIIGHTSQLTAEPFLGDEDAMLANMLPDDPAFDMAVNIFTYQSGAVLPFVETHVMEHGLYMTQGQGIYRLNESWYPVGKGDSIWMAAYCPQWFVAMGKEPAQYVYYKDVNRFHLPG